MFRSTEKWLDLAGQCLGNRDCLLNSIKMVVRSSSGYYLTGCSGGSGELTEPRVSRW
jgi:hypothetical protein